LLANVPRDVEGEEGIGSASYFAGFVLCDLVLGVLLAVFALAVGAAGFGYVDLNENPIISMLPSKLYTEVTRTIHEISYRPPSEVIDALVDSEEGFHQSSDFDACPTQQLAKESTICPCPSAGQAVELFLLGAIRRIGSLTKRME
jgi:hypothetical protein